MTNSPARRGRAAARLRRSCVAVALALAAGGARPRDLAAQTLPAVRDLPAVATPAAAPAAGTLAVLLSGDGGWADIDRTIAARLATRGVGVVGLDTRAYLAHGRTPDQAAADVARLADAYLAAWGARRLVLVGYSRGAGMVPFVATRLPPALRARVALLAMLGLEPDANFQFHWVDLVRTVHRPDDLPVAPELARLRGTRMLCVYGTDERDSGCRDADPTLITRVARAGDHHLGGDYAGLADLIVGSVPP